MERPFYGEKKQSKTKISDNRNKVVRHTQCMQQTKEEAKKRSSKHTTPQHTAPVHTAIWSVTWLTTICRPQLGQRRFRERERERADIMNTYKSPYEDEIRCFRYEEFGFLCLNYPTLSHSLHPTLCPDSAFSLRTRSLHKLYLTKDCLW